MPAIWTSSWVSDESNSSFSFLGVAPNAFQHLIFHVVEDSFCMIVMQKSSPFERLTIGS